MSDLSKTVKPFLDFPETILILGSMWRIEIRNYNEDPYFKKYDADGYCSSPEKLIVVCDLYSDPAFSGETPEFISNSANLVLKHEIVHAYLYESGLGNDAFYSKGPWTRNEEMVDWIARQGQKIYRTWAECKCLEVVSSEIWTKMTKMLNNIKADLKDEEVNNGIKDE